MKEIECRFLEIDKGALISKLVNLGAEDLGENMLEETIIYDKEGKWKEEQRFVRLRKFGDKTELTYKEHHTHTIDGSYEINLDINDYEKAEILFEKIGLAPWRHQQKLRHTLRLDGVTFDIDTWPKVPPYVELESESEQAIKDVVIKIGYNWENAIFNNAGWVLERKYGIRVIDLTWFTFDRIE